MLQDIDDLVQTDFCTEMDMKLLPKSKEYTQKEAKEMANLLGKIYLISHAIHCKSCGKKYE